MQRETCTHRPICARMARFQRPWGPMERQGIHFESFWHPRRDPVLEGSGNHVGRRRGFGWVCGWVHCIVGVCVCVRTLGFLYMRP